MLIKCAVISTFHYFIFLKKKRKKGFTTCKCNLCTLWVVSALTGLIKQDLFKLRQTFFQCLFTPQMHTVKLQHQGINALPEYSGNKTK